MMSRLVIVVIAVCAVRGIRGLPWPTQTQIESDTLRHTYRPTSALNKASFLPYHVQQGAVFGSEGDAGDQREKRATLEPPVAVTTPTDEYLPLDDDEEEAVDENDSSQDDANGASQHFFPSYFPNFGSSRLSQFYQNPSSRPTVRSNNYQTVSSNVYQAEADTTQSNLLGSGNFGVIPGGTYYNDGDREHGQASEYDNHQVYSPYYHNGHGRPSFYKGGGSNPRPQKQGNDFFANFRDFADINTPTKSSYSELYVVYVNQNATRNDQQPNVMVPGERPKNIIEQLTLIESEKEMTTLPSVSPKTEKLSKTKLKLARTFKTKQEKVKKSTSPKELYEPLLALS